MVSLFLFLALALTVVCFILYEHFARFFWFVIGVIFAIIALCLAFNFVYLIDNFANSHIIDDTIAMYEEENATIEENIDEIVKNYMDYETTTYEKFKNEDSMNLISLFPELKSDTLISQQIEIYVANNQKIKELKEEKIHLAKTKWLLSFGI